MHPSQYYLSGLLTAAGCPYWVLVASLAVIAERVFNVFDATRAGLVVSLATATLGPLVEVRAPDLTKLDNSNTQMKAGQTREQRRSTASSAFVFCYVHESAFDACTTRKEFLAGRRVFRASVKPK